MNMYNIKENYESRKHTWDEQEEHYWSKERMKRAYAIEKDVYEYATKLIDGNQYKKILDLGCGYAVKWKNYRKGHVFITGCDYDERILKINNEKFKDIRFMKLDIDAKNSEYEKYDMIIMADVIEHLMHPDKALEYIYNSLNDEGIAIISTPERDIARGKDCTYSKKKEHVREWNYQEFETFITSMNFQILKHEVVQYARFNILKNPILYLKRNVIYRKRYKSCQVVTIKKL